MRNRIFKNYCISDLNGKMDTLHEAASYLYRMLLGTVCLFQKSSTREPGIAVLTVHSKNLQVRTYVYVLITEVSI